MTFDDEWYNDRPYITAYTSGSTGTPKAIRLSKANMRLSAESTCRFFHIDSSSVIAQVLSDEYIAGKMMRVRADVSGARLYREKPSATPLAGCSPDDHFRLVAIVPMQLEGLLQARCQIDYVIVGGAPVTYQQEKLMEDCWMQGGPRFYITYGMTETCSHVALRRPCYRFYRRLPGNVFSCDENGRLRITNDRAEWSPVQTNDIVELRDSLTFLWKGRADNVINSGGVKIHPEEIEQWIGSLSGGEAFVVTSRPSERYGSEAVVLVERGLRPDEKLTAELTARIECLDGKRRPKAIIVVDRIERTASGKIKRCPLSSEDGNTEAEML